MANQIPLAIADVELQLSSAITVGGTSFTLSSATDDDGIALPAGKYCFTIDNGTSAKEYLLGQLNDTTVTSVVSVSRQGTETSGAARAHRVGASAILTDFATIQRVADILRGVEELDGTSPVKYDTQPTLTDGKELATVQYVLDLVNGGTVSFSSQIITGVNAGESVVAGNLVYFKESDQEWYKADADSSTTVDGSQLGIALGTGSNGVAITGGVQLSGVYTTSGLTAGSKYYASNTAGEVSTTEGTTSVFVGWALSTTKLLLAPRTTQIPTTDQKAAIAGDSITPVSATNPLIAKYSPRFGVRKMIAGATINGGTLPVPVYQNKSDNEFYACDGNDTSALKFVGFAVSNGTNGSTLEVQYNGVVTGFTALDEGEKYYLSDTAGTISTTAGTYEVLVGRAISTTELLIEKGSRRASGNGGSVGTASGSTAVTCGFRPSIVRVYGYGGSTTHNTAMTAIYTNGALTGVSTYQNEATEITTTNTARIYGAPSTTYMEFTITSVTDTGFTVTWTESGVFTDTGYFLWEAEGEI